MPNVKGLLAALEVAEESTSIKAVTYNETTGAETEISAEELTGSDWYNYYGETTSGLDSKNSKWANIKVDGSYFVWIPRYE